MSQYYVYILASQSRTLYVGMTSDLARRLHEHRTRHASAAFTAQYQVHRLVYYEVAANPYAAIAREKELKNLSREKKIALIEIMNPGWEDLSVALNLTDDEG
jgi:putative endonuclease